jgi:hypothetical protein
MPEAASKAAHDGLFLIAKIKVLPSAAVAAGRKT